jgi:hypothetical protein
MKEAKSSSGANLGFEEKMWKAADKLALLWCLYGLTGMSESLPLLSLPVKTSRTPLLKTPFLTELCRFSPF